MTPSEFPLKKRKIIASFDDDDDDAAATRKISPANQHQITIERESLTCPICRDVFQGTRALTCPACRNCFCAPCLVDITQCPCCRAAITADNCYPNRIVDAILRAMSAECKYVGRGCGETMLTRETITAHERDCMYQAARCDASLLGCAWNGHLLHKDEHHTACTFKRIFEPLFEQFRLNDEKLELVREIDRRHKADFADYRRRIKRAASTAQYAKIKRVAVYELMYNKILHIRYGCILRFHFCEAIFREALSSTSSSSLVPKHGCCQAFNITPNDGNLSIIDRHPHAQENALLNNEGLATLYEWSMKAEVQHINPTSPFYAAVGQLILSVMHAPTSEAQANEKMNIHGSILLTTEDILPTNILPSNTFHITCTPNVYVKIAEFQLKPLLSLACASIHCCMVVQAYRFT